VDNLIRQHLGPYRILKQAGAGGLATVHAVGVVAMLALSLVLGCAPLRVAETTPTPPGTAASAPPTSRPAVTPTSQPTATPVPNPTFSPTHTPEPTKVPFTAGPSPVAALRWEPLADDAPFFPIALNTLVVDPNDPDTIFAGTYGAGIYVSRDGGQTWIPSNVGLGKGTVGTIAIDPTNSDVVYAALFDQGGVYKSTDGGRTWTAANQGINLDGAWNWTGLVYLDPTDSSHLYYSGSTNGFYHSDDGGATWEQVSYECPSVLGLAVDPGDGEHLYASSGQPGPTCLAGIYESRDGGRTWRWLITNEMATPDAGNWWRMAADPKDFDTLYAGGQRETYKTSDGGQSWTPILDHACDWLAASEVALYCGAGSGQLISLDGGQSWGIVGRGAGWGSERQPFAIVPGDPYTLYAGSDTVMRSTDGGWTWTYIGLPGASARMRLTVDPRDGRRLFLSGVDHAYEVFRSGDGGRTWQVVATYGGWNSQVTVDPVRGIVYLPSISGDLYRSRDDGQTWEKFGSGYPGGGLWQLVPDPQDANRLWLIHECSGRPCLSEDDGETFAEIEGFPRGVCQPILLVCGDGRRIYVVAWEGFARSDDGGVTWRALGGLGGIYRAAALDPSNPDVVYVGSTYKGVLKTEDGGSTWRQINAGLTSPSINELAIDPAMPQTIYAATAGGAFVSVDGGEHWSLIQEGLGSNPIVYSIAVDPNDSSMVYAVTPDGIFRLVGAPPAIAGSASSGLP